MFTKPRGMTIQTIWAGAEIDRRPDCPVSAAGGMLDILKKPEG
jgi:hypothetical protein